jgi:hypothetical protein
MKAKGTREFRARLTERLHHLKEVEASKGGSQTHHDLDLFEKIRNHKTAISLTEQAEDGNLEPAELIKQLNELNLQMNDLEIIVIKSISREANELATRISTTTPEDTEKNSKLIQEKIDQAFRAGLIIGGKKKYDTFTNINNFQVFRDEDGNLTYSYDEIGESVIPDLTDEAKQLLMEAANDQKGMITKVRAKSGLTVQTNGINFADQGNPRSEALWEQAIDLLVAKGLIVDVGYKGEIFRITADGYQVADHLSANPF